MIALLRPLWDEPRPADPPAPGWRDRALVAALAVAAVLEATFRSDLAMPVLQAVVALALLPALLWRRTHPLLTTAIAFAACGVVAVVTGGDVPQLSTVAYLLIFASPAPVVAHILAIMPFTVLGALQFVPALRRRRPGWHRMAGRVVVVSGIVVALSGLWMTLFYPRPEGDGILLEWFRFFFGSAMLVSIVLGFAAVRRRDIARHRIWMMRAYAIGMGAGTQVLTNLPWIVLVGKPTEFPRAMLLLAGWVINVAVVEWVVRRGPLRVAAQRRRAEVRPELTVARSG